MRTLSLLHLNLHPQKPRKGDISDKGDDGSDEASDSATVTKDFVTSKRADKNALRDLALSVVKSKKIICVTGAGISCSSGIPDFRSQDGLYNLVKHKHPKSFITGKDLFSASVFRSPATSSIFYTFISSLSTASSAASPTPTHRFIKTLSSQKKLLRCYTQNVDGLEARVGMESKAKNLDKGKTKVVELHGSVHRVRCGMCSEGWEMRKEWLEIFESGMAPDCPACVIRAEDRLKRGARAISAGKLRPDMVLYDENHPSGEEIGLLQDHDINRSPDCLIIMGTSLKVSGIKALVKDFANAVHGGQAESSASGRKRNGEGGKTFKVIYVNKEPPSSEWNGFIDFHVQGNTDDWVKGVEEEWKRSMPGDWEMQTKLGMERHVVGKDTEREIKAKPRQRAKLGKTSSLQDITNTSHSSMVASTPLIAQKQVPPPMSPKLSSSSFFALPMSPRASLSPVKTTSAKRRSSSENEAEDEIDTTEGSRAPRLAEIPPMTPGATPRKTSSSAADDADSDSELSVVPDSDSDVEFVQPRPVKRRKMANALKQKPVQRMLFGVEGAMTVGEKSCREEPKQARQRKPLGKSASRAIELR